MNKKISFIFFCVLIINSLSQISATVDIKMKVKYCEFAVSNTDVSKWEFQDSLGTKESDVFKPWNNVTQEGIYLLSTNKNLNLGEPSNYEFTRYTGNKSWFNEFRSDSSTSNIPIINVGIGEEKHSYTRCKFIVGNYRIFLLDHGYCDIGYLTDDFNLTTEIIPQDTSSGSPSISIFGNFLAHMHPGSVVNNLYPGEDGLFPYSKPYIIYSSKNLEKRATSLIQFRMSWLVRELGSINAVSSPQPNYIFYINNSNPIYAPENYLTVEEVKDNMTKKDENTGQLEHGASTSLNITSGHNYTSITFFKNKYNTTLSIDFRQTFEHASFARIARGLGLGDIPLFSIPAYQYETITFAPGETKSMTMSRIIPEGIIGYSLATMLFRNSNATTMNWLYSWPKLGSDSYPYLSFTSIDPRIEMTKVNGQYKPIFNMTIGLHGESSFYNLNISQDDYEVEARLYNGSVSTSNLIFTKIYPLPSDLPKGDTPFRIIIPINSTWEEGKYYVKFLSLMKKALPAHPGFKDKYISMFYGNPYFKPGDIAYPHDLTLNFGSNSKQDVEQITLFNPSFYPDTIKLNVTGWSNDNFTLSWDGKNFNQYSEKETALRPLGAKDLTFWVNATHDPWVTSSQTETLEITATVDFLVNGSIEHKEQVMTFTLEMSPNSINWINLVVKDIAPEVVNLDDENSTKEETIIAEWSVDGSNSGMAPNLGKEYKVNLTLLNITGTEVVLATKKQNFTISRGVSSMSFDYNLEQGDYKIIANIDTKNQIEENFSSGNTAEGDNILVQKLGVINCNYSTTLIGNCSLEDSIIKKYITTNPECSNKNETYLCAQEVKLSFFSSISMIVTILIIAFFYSFQGIPKKSHHLGPH